MKNKRVVITGIGPISSLGLGVEGFWNSILKGETNIAKERFSLDGQNIDEFYKHKVADFNIYDFFSDKSELDNIVQWKGDSRDIDLEHILVAIKLALEDSALIYNTERNNISLVIGHGNPGLEDFWEKLYSETFDIFNNAEVKLSKVQYFKTFYDRFVKTSYDLQTYMYLFHVAKIFKLYGQHIFINNACSSGLYALDIAQNLISTNKCNTAIIAASGRSKIFKYLWFKQFGYPYAKDGKIKSFSSEADGLVLGDGTIALVIEDLSHAIDRKAKIYGEYLGGSFQSESWKVTLPAINKSTYRDIMRDALNKCNLTPENINHLNPHGTGLKIVDQYEIKAINSIFKNINISAFKPYIGHCIGASALLETAIALLSLKNNIIPGMLHNSPIGFKKSMINFVTKTRKIKLNYVMKTCCAIAGFDSAVIFKKYENI